MNEWVCYRFVCVWEGGGRGVMRRESRIVTVSPHLALRLRLCRVLNVFRGQSVLFVSLLVWVLGDAPTCVFLVGTKGPAPLGQEECNVRADAISRCFPCVFLVYRLIASMCVRAFSGSAVSSTCSSPSWRFSSTSPTDCEINGCTTYSSKWSAGDHRQGHVPHTFSGLLWISLYMR